MSKLKKNNRRQEKIGMRKKIEREKERNLETSWRCMKKLKKKQ